ncbi:MAG: MCE family protein [Myxococcales bacterium]|nr:MCE family protein [Myxococcales bacterium]
MSTLARATTIVVLGSLALGAGYGIYRAARPKTYGQRFHTYAYFRDANGLPVGSRVMIAGIVVGEIDALAIENGQARVSLRLRDDVVLWDDAWAEKKAASPLADNYVEISPGGPEPDETAAGHRQLRSGEPIARVLETATTDRALRGLEQAIPRAADRAEVANEATDRARQFVAGPLSERMTRLDRQLRAGELAEPLEAAAARTDAFDRSLARAQARVHGLVPTAGARLDGLVADTAAARDRLRAARGDVADGMAEVRRGLDEVDGYAANAGALLAELAEPDRDRQGRLARLIDDPTAADDLADTTASLADAARDLDRLQALVGLRAEWNLVAAAPRFVVSAEIGTRRDTFYLIEVEQGPWGDVAAPTLTENPDGTFTRRTTIADGARFTAQWGRRLGPLAFRAGIRESRFGVGVDAVLGEGRLRLSLDTMASSFTRLPRVRLLAALQVFRSMYVLGGVDDALVGGTDLPIGPGPAAPHTLSTLHFGRDFVLGAELRFDDRDVSALLRLYGALIATILS